MNSDFCWKTWKLNSSLNCVRRGSSLITSNCPRVPLEPLSGRRMRPKSQRPRLGPPAGLSRPCCRRPFRSWSRSTRKQRARSWELAVLVCDLKVQFNLKQHHKHKNVRKELWRLIFAVKPDFYDVKRRIKTQFNNYMFLPEIASVISKGTDSPGGQGIEKFEAGSSFSPL